MAELCDTWPRSLDEAVGSFLGDLTDAERAKLRDTEEGELIRFHLGWGARIRSAFGLWGHNAELLRSCAGGEGVIHPDTASMVIIKAAWRRLRAGV